MDNLAGSQKVGGVHITVGIEGAEKTKAELHSVGQATEQVGQKATQAGEETSKSFLKADGPIKEFGKSIRQSIGAITGFVGALGAAVGVATTLYQLGKKLGESLMESANAAERLKLNLATTASGAAGNYKMVTEEVERLEAAMGRLSGHYDQSANEARRATEKQLKALRELQAQYHRQLQQGDKEEQRQREEKAALEKFKMLREKQAESDRADLDGMNELAAFAKKLATENAEWEIAEEKRVIDEREKREKEYEDARRQWQKQRYEEAAEGVKMLESWTDKLRKQNDGWAEAASKARQEHERALAAIREQVREQNSRVGLSSGGGFSSDEVLRELQYISSRIGGGGA